MTSSAIPPHLKELLGKLEFISMCPKNRKICFGDSCFVSGWKGSIQRAIKGEGRKSMVTALNSIVDEAINALTSYSGTEYVSLIVNALARSKTGLTNLMETYAFRADTVSSLRIVLLNIELTLDKYKHLIHGHYVNSNAIPIPSMKKKADSDESDESSKPGGPGEKYGVSPIEG